MKLVKHWNKLPGEDVESVFGDLQNLMGHVVFELICLVVIEEVNKTANYILVILEGKYARR